MTLGKTKRTAANAWIESIDPLNGLSIAQAKTTYNAARRHGSPLLQKIFAEIEETDPILMTCVDRRQSALAGLGWRAVANPSAKDQTLAEEQRDALDNFARSIPNLSDAIEHLGLAFFRGYSVIQPVWSSRAAGASSPAVSHIALLDSWNFLRGENGELLWNPLCSMDPKDCEPITPAARIVKMVRRRAIDWPALSIYIRKYIGERDWGRFLERYGIPPVDVVMAPNTTEAQKADYIETGEAAKNGQTAAWPSGSVVSRAEGSRGQDPFSAFIEHQEKLIVLMATGGTLTSLAQADTGSLAGGAQYDVWTQIVSRDGVAISTALNRDLFSVYLREAFPGREVSASIELGKEDEPTALEAADLAVKLRGAGYIVVQSELEEATGLSLEKDAPAPNGFMNSEISDAPLTLRHLNKRSVSEASDESELNKDSDDRAVLEAFAADNSPAAKAVAELLKDPSPDAAKALIDKLPTLLPKEPDLAAVIADAMAAEFASVLSGGEGVAPRASAKNKADDDDDDVPDTDDDLDEMEALANKIDANGMGHDDDNGQFDGSGSGGGSGRSSIDDLIARETAAHAERMAKIKGDIAAIRARRAEARKAGKKKIEGLKAKREQTRAEIMRMHVEAWKKRVAAQQAAVKNKITNPCPKCHRQMPEDGTCSFCAKRAANHAAGKSAFDKVAKDHADVVGAMERDSIGKIDFIWGDDSEGICHILGKHKNDASMIPGVIAYGDIYEDAANGKYYAIKKRNLVVLRKRTNGNHYLITGYKKDDPNAIAKIRKESRLVEKGE